MVMVSLWAVLWSTQIDFLCDHSAIFSAQYNDKTHKRDRLFLYVQLYNTMLYKVIIDIAFKIIQAYILLQLSL